MGGGGGGMGTGRGTDEMRVGRILNVCSDGGGGGGVLCEYFVMKTIFWPCYVILNVYYIFLMKLTAVNIITIINNNNTVTLVPPFFTHMGQALAYSQC